MSYLDLLNYLLNLGPKLPPIIASIQRIVEEIQIIRGLLGMAETFAAIPATADELAAEQKVIEASMGGAETFGGPLQRVLEFIRNNPELVALLLSLLKK